jgi:hypothetical protein
MAISIRHSSLGRPNLIIIENQFLIHCMEKGAANSSKSLITIQRRNESYGPFDPSIKPGSTRPQHHRESIPHPLHGKGHPKTPVKVLSRSNGQIESYGPFDPSIQPGSTRAHHHRVSIPHPLHGTGYPETPVKV